MSPDISGTYNNQYMVLDLKRVKPKYSLDTETLFIVEQIPSYIEFSDQTDVLRKGTFFMLQAGSVMSMCDEYVCVFGGECVACECLMGEYVVGRTG